MGASKPATYGHFKTSHQFQGFAFPFSLYPPSFPVQSIRNRLGFLFPPEARTSRRHNIPADDRSPGCESHPDRLKPPPRQGPPSRFIFFLSYLLLLFSNPYHYFHTAVSSPSDAHHAGAECFPPAIAPLHLAVPPACTHATQPLSVTHPATQQQSLTNSIIRRCPEIT